MVNPVLYLKLKILKFWSICKASNNNVILDSKFYVTEKWLVNNHLQKNFMYEEISLEDKVVPEKRQ